MQTPEPNPCVVENVSDCHAVREGIIALPESSAPEGIHAIISSTLLNRNLSISTKRVRIAESVVHELSDMGAFYFNAERKDFATAMYFNQETKSLERIQSDRFQSWLATWLSINRAEALFQFIVRAVEDAALSGPEAKAILPERYWAARPPAIYLSNGAGQIAKITAAGVSLVDNGTDEVLFDCGKTLLPWGLVEPVDPFVSCALFRDVSVQNPLDHLALKLWVLAVPSQHRSKPPLAFVGEIGSGKTRLASGLAQLFGVPPQEAKADEKKEGDFWAALDQGGLFTLDNADSRISWLPDAVASAATGGKSVKRKLFTDGDTITLHSNAHLIVTCANPTFAEDPGLADRLIVVRLDRRTGKTSDKALSDEIAYNRDASLSFIAHTLARTLEDTLPLPSGLNLRHPDYADLAVRIGRAMGCENTAIESLKRTETQKAVFCLENDLIGAALRHLVDEKTEFTGTAADLLGALNAADPDFAKQSITARGLSKRLGLLWPHLASTMKASKKTAHGGSMQFTFNQKE